MFLRLAAGLLDRFIPVTNKLAWIELAKIESTSVLGDKHSRQGGRGWVRSDSPSDRG